MSIPKIGTLFLHKFLDMGLFIVVYDTGKRLGLRSIETGDIRYITSSHMSSQYMPLHRSNNWWDLEHMRAHMLHSQHILHLQYCNSSYDPTRFTSHVHIAYTAWHIYSINAVRAHVALATKLPFKALYSYPLPKGEQKYPRKIPTGNLLYITIKDGRTDRNWPKKTLHNYRDNLIYFT